MSVRPVFILWLGLSLMLLAFGGCAVFEESACGAEMSYRNGMCEGFDGFRYVRVAPRHWVPGARS